MIMDRRRAIDESPPQNELIEEYVNSLDKSENTVSTYRGNLSRYARYLKGKGIAKPKESDLVLFKRHLKDKGCHGVTVQLYVVTLRGFYKWAERMGYYPDISISLTNEHIEPTFKRQSLTAEEANKLLKKCKSRAKRGITFLRDYAIISLIVTTGLRTVEVSRADVEDIVSINGITYLYVQGKGHDDKDDPIKLPDYVLETINEYLSKRDSDAKPLFLNHGKRSDKTRIKPKTISELVKNSLRLIGLDDKRYTAHSLRHTCATIALLNGASIQEVQMTLRHKSINTTTIYTHNLSRETNDVENIVAKAIRKGK